MGGEGMRGSTRPRVYCPRCRRSVAVTFNAIDGKVMYLRTHNAEPGERCSASRSTLSTERHTLHEKGAPARVPPHDHTHGPESYGYTGADGRGRYVSVCGICGYRAAPEVAW